MEKMKWSREIMRQVENEVIAYIKENEGVEEMSKDDQSISCMIYLLF